MKFLVTQSLILSLIFSNIGFTQNKTIVSDLENLTLDIGQLYKPCLLYTSPSPRDRG